VSDVPASVSKYLHSLFYTDRAIAYLHVDAALFLTAMGGDLASHGLTDLRLQQPICDQLGFLEGLLPLIESPLLLRSMQTSAGCIADVHLFTGEEGDWIIFIDV
jgi:hypothetical protein